MNKLLLSFIVFFSLMNHIMYSQENIKTEFYNIKIPEKTTVKEFNSSHEDLANIDAYQFGANEKPKYIAYFMSNKTNIEIASVNLDNYKDFLFDLGELKVSGIENLTGKIKIYFTYVDNDNIKGIIYAYVKNDILNRFVFLLPNQNAKDVFQKEIDTLVDGIVEIKSNW